MTTYRVADRKFSSFSAAVSAAQPKHEEVFEVPEHGPEIRRWAPGTVRTRQVQHVIVRSDGTLQPFGRVRQ